MLLYKLKYYMVNDRFTESLDPETRPMTQYKNQVILV